MDQNTPENRIKDLEAKLEEEQRARKKLEAAISKKNEEVSSTRTALSQNTRLLEAVTIHAKDAVIITDANLETGPHIIYVNDSFTQISGYSPSEVIGKTPKILQGEDTDQVVLRELSQKLSKGEHFQGELKNYKKDGTPYWLDISIVPVKDETGKILNFAAIERDITDRKNYEHQLEAAKIEAEEINSAKSSFLATISHELRTPMNGIIGLSDLLLDTALDKEQEESIVAINRSAEGLLVLLNDILDLSKIEAQEMTLEQIPFDLRQIVHDTISILKNQAEKRRLNLTFHYTPATPDWIIGDSARLRQILTNLVGNAIKFTEEGDVSLSVCNEGRELHFRVDDTGIGIPADRLDDIFNKFTQADTPTTRRFGGTGLGLAICKNLIEMMGGAVGVESIVGRGSTFWFKIPLNVYEPTEEESSIFQKRTVNGEDIEQIKAGMSILVVDDHPVNLMFTRKLLKKLGIDRIQLADNGTEALEYVQTMTYNIILMDCQMPDMDGFETTRHIRNFQEKIDAYTPIIALTANAMKGDREKCLAAGMDDYLTKPIKIDSLSKTIAKWDSVSRNRQQIHASQLELESVNTEKDYTVETDDFKRPLENEPNVVPNTTVEEKNMLAHAHSISELLSDENTIKRIENELAYTCPVDLEHFNFMMEDCTQEEKEELLGLFEEQSELSLTALHDALESESQDEWKKAAHKLKGSSANLGGNDLSSVCAEAEGAMTMPKSAKAIYMDKIIHEYQRLKVYLDKNLKS